MRSIVSRVRGFSLIELVVYLAIVTVVSVTALVAIGDIVQLFGRIRIERRVAYAGEVAMESSIRNIRNGTFECKDSKPVISVPSNVQVYNSSCNVINNTAAGTRVTFTIQAGDGRYKVSRVFSSFGIKRTP